MSFKNQADATKKTEQPMENFPLELPFTIEEILDREEQI